MRRSPIKRRTPLRRKTRIAQVNRARKRKRHALQFGEQAALCRRSPCLVCGRSPCDPHHEPTVARGGLDKDTVPLCRVHHDERHTIGRAAFEERHGLDLVVEAGKVAS